MKKFFRVIDRFEKLLLHLFVPRRHQSQPVIDVGIDFDVGVGVDINVVVVFVDFRV